MTDYTVVNFFWSDEKTLRFVNSKDAGRLAALGRSCLEHVLRTKKIAAVHGLESPGRGSPPRPGPSSKAAAPKARLKSGLGQNRKACAADYAACKNPNSPAKRDPNPTVVLIPGPRMIA